MKHIFDVDIAKEYGVPEAIILENIWFWIQHNTANDVHFYEGRYWTFNSIKAFTELFPYYSKDQLYRTIERLKAKELIVTGNFNKATYDRTLWYALTDKALDMLENAKCNSRKREMEMAKTQNGNSENAKPIPDINTNINTNINCCSHYNPIEDLQYTLGYLPTGYQAEKFVDLFNEVGEIVFHKALEKAANKNARNFSYVEAAAKGIAEGKDFDKTKQQEPEEKQGTKLTPEKQAIYDKLMAKCKERKNG